MTRLPLPLRRLAWLVGLNFGRQRANYFGSFVVTSVAAYGGGELHALSPGPFILSYGVVEPDQTIDVVIRWDHRITDAALIAKALTRLEQVLNTEIAAELRGSGQAAKRRQPKRGPGGRDLTTSDPLFIDRTARFLPRNRLLAGRFRPAMRFATRGLSPSSFGAGPVGSGQFPAHRRARFLKPQTSKRTR